MAGGLQTSAPSPGRDTDQRARYRHPFSATNPPRHSPGRPRRKRSGGRFAATHPLARPSARTLFSFASSVRGVREKRGRGTWHPATWIFPAPVGPDIAKIPAEAKGSSVKSLENSPFQRRQIASSDRQHSHKETSLITSLNNVSISSATRLRISRQTYASAYPTELIFCKSLYDKARSSASPSRRGYEGTMEVRRTAFP